MKNKREAQQKLAEHYVFRAFVIGIVGLLVAIYNTPKSFYAFEFLLTEVSGQVEFVEKIRDKKTFFLQIKFKENPKKYLLKDIGNVNYFFKIEEVINKLKTPKKATVLIKESEMNASEIEVYQIADSNKILFHLDDIEAHKKLRFYLTLCVGVLGVVLFLVNKKVYL